MATQDETYTNLEGVAHAADAILGQCAQMLGSVGTGAYTAESKVLKGGTIGKHVRHALDHYCALLDCDCDTPVDYDHRDRQTAVESDPKAAAGEIERLRSCIAGLGEDDMCRGSRIRVMLSGSGDEAVLGSTVARELFFATHHAIHHQAMIKAIAAEHGAELPSAFGTAPSTINFQQNAG